MKKRRSADSNDKSHAGSAKIIDADRATLDMFVDSVKDYAIFSVDPAGIVTSWNIGAERINGYAADEIVGKSWSVFHTDEDVVRGRPSELMRRAAAEGRTEDDGIRVRKGGAQFPAHVVLSAVRDESGTLTGFMNVTQDITDKERIQRELRENEQQFRLFSQNFPGFNWIADPAGRYVFGNSNFEHGRRLAATDWHGKAPEELFSPDVAKTIQESNAIVVSTKAPVLLTEKVIADGVPQYYLVSKFPIHRGNEMLIGGVSIDITSRIEAEEELKRVREELFRQERLGSIAQLSSALAHDLNNTLNAISLRLWAMRADKNSTQQAGIDKITRLVARAADSVARLQTFVRTHREPQLEQLDLAEVIRTAVESVHPSLLERHHTIDTSQVPATLPPVLGLASDLHQVFTNLLKNAGDATAKDGVIEVSASVSDKQIEVSIADRGSGIPVDSLEKIFEPFFTTKSKPGSGLGLSFATSVMARLGGNIGASNRVEGGAVFVLTFPIAQAEAFLPAGSPEIVPAASSRSVLVVDDDHENLESMKAALELRGYDVTISSSGAEALEWLRSGRQFDSIICDIGMPDMNGWEVAAKISELRSRARVFMLSGWANEIPESDPRRKLVVDVLAKPVDLERIEGILRNN